MWSPEQLRGSLGLCTDLYELRMAASYLRHGLTAPATFSLFVRRLPAERGYLVAAGLESCLDLLEDLSLGSAELDYLHEELGFEARDLEALRDLRFTGSVRAMPEGTVFFAGEPVLEVTAPLPQAQLVETMLLNQVTFATAVASKAARCRLAAPRARMVDFAARRAHGLEAAMTVARAAVLGGFDATSFVQAARAFDLPAVGTMAHSFVEAHPSERAAFATFADDFPASTVFLVDTYDTLSGVRHAIGVADALALGAPGSGAAGWGIRLDSGDLGSLAASARLMLDQAGHPTARIMASGGLDEYAVAGLVGRGAPIDDYAIGTRLGVSWDAPSLDSAYKLVAVGERAVMKLSPGKLTAPGPKQVFRPMVTHDDVIALAEEPVPIGYEPLLVPVMVDGRRTDDPPSVAVLRQRVAEQVRRLPAAARELHAPRAPLVRHSDRLDGLTQRLAGQLYAQLSPA